MPPLPTGGASVTCSVASTISRRDVRALPELSEDRVLRELLPVRPTGVDSDTKLPSGVVEPAQRCQRRRDLVSRRAV
jgi:hypothetical protein